MSDFERGRKEAPGFEGNDILVLIELLKTQGIDINSFELESLVDDELTKGRVRTIYTQLKYGTKTIQEVAEYYELPKELLRDIKHGKAFRGLTRDIDDM